MFGLRNRLSNIYYVRMSARNLFFHGTCTAYSSWLFLRTNYTNYYTKLNLFLWDLEKKINFYFSIFGTLWIKDRWIEVLPVCCLLIQVAKQEMFFLFCCSWIFGKLWFYPLSLIGVKFHLRISFKSQI